MKRFLYSLIVILSGCATTNSLVKNYSAVSSLETILGYGSGVLVDKTDIDVTLLSVAHICKFDYGLQTIETTLKKKCATPCVLTEKDNKLLNDVIDKFITTVETSVDACDLKVSVLGIGDSLPAKIFYIDFSKDILLAKIPMKNTTSIDITNIIRIADEIHMKEDIYVISPISNVKSPIIVYSKIGPYMPVQIKSNAMHLIQTQFILGPGSSGSPVYLEKNDNLVGIYSVEAMEDPEIPTNVRISFFIPIWDIKQAYKESSENKFMCKGSDLNCKIFDIKKQNKTKFKSELITTIKQNIED